MLSLTPWAWEDSAAAAVAAVAARPPPRIGWGPVGPWGRGPVGWLGRRPEGPGESVPFIYTSTSYTSVFPISPLPNILSYMECYFLEFSLDFFLGNFLSCLVQVVHQSVNSVLEGTGCQAQLRPDFLGGSFLIT